MNSASGRRWYTTNVRVRQRNNRSNPIVTHLLQLLQPLGPQPCALQLKRALLCLRRRTTPNKMMKRISHLLEWLRDEWQRYKDLLSGMDTLSRSDASSDLRERRVAQQQRRERERQREKGG